MARENEEGCEAPPQDDIAWAQVSYDEAEHQLLMAEESYASARLALDHARPRLHLETPPRTKYHYVCGHDGVRETIIRGDEIFDLCAACRARVRNGSLSFTQLRGLMVPRVS